MAAERVVCTDCVKRQGGSKEPLYMPDSNCNWPLTMSGSGATQSFWTTECTCRYKSMLPVVFLECTELTTAYVVCLVAHPYHTPTSLTRLAFVHFSGYYTQHHRYPITCPCTVPALTQSRVGKKSDFGPSPPATGRVRDLTCSDRHLYD